MNGTTVLVLGLGASGLAMSAWCVRAGAQVRVWDSRAAPPMAGALADQVPAAQRVAVLDDAALDGVSQVLKSPGLAPHDARIAPLLAAAKTKRIPVRGELDLFVEALAALKAERGYAPKLIAITGTNGKTTTTNMARLLVERTGQSVAMAGNVGPTMLQTLQQAMETGEPLPDAWVLELSSFQLDGVSGFEPDAATVLNVTQDHLDWHGDLASYAAAKARVFGRHGVMVINRDDALVEAMIPPPQPPSKGRKPVPREVVRFGLDAPQRGGDFGLVTEGGMAWLVRALPPEESRGRKATDDDELHLQRLMPADALRVRGRHNAANALAALALATAIGCPLAPMLHGLREYGGEPHRVEHLGSVAGVDAFDDSKGTNVGATVAALDGLGADKAPSKLIVILGGDGKGQDFAPLTGPVARHARAVATIGRDAGAIETVLADSGVPLQRHASLEAAVRWCFAQAHAGDAVLLSPACASLDMFRDYAHRAAVFTDEVRAIAAERGEVMT